MKKKNKRNEGFFIETIELSPSNNIQPNGVQDYPPAHVPDYDTGNLERMHGHRQFKKITRKLKNNIVIILLFVLCIYMVFLIIGALRTNYYIDADTGTRKPIFVTYKDVADKQDYTNLKKEMTQLREILVDVRITELKYNNKEISAYEAANNYKNHLEKIDLIIPKLSALSVGSEQDVPKTAMLSCYTTYLAGYLQEMHKGLANSDATAIDSALQYRKLMFQSYNDAELALKVLGDKLKLSDEFFEWELDKAAKDKDPTVILPS